MITKTRADLQTEWKQRLTLAVSPNIFDRAPVITAGCASLDRSLIATEAAKPTDTTFADRISTAAEKKLISRSTEVHAVRHARNRIAHHPEILPAQATLNAALELARADFELNLNIPLRAENGSWPRAQETAMALLAEDDDWLRAQETALRNIAKSMPVVSSRIEPTDLNKQFLSLLLTRTQIEDDRIVALIITCTQMDILLIQAVHALGGKYGDDALADFTSKKLYGRFKAAHERPFDWIGGEPDATVLELIIIRNHWAHEGDLPQKHLPNGLTTEIAITYFDATWKAISRLQAIKSKEASPPQPPIVKRPKNAPPPEPPPPPPPPPPEPPTWHVSILTSARLDEIGQRLNDELLARAKAFHNNNLHGSWWLEPGLTKKINFASAAGWLKVNAALMAALNAYDAWQPGSTKPIAEDPNSIIGELNSAMQALLDHPPGPGNNEPKPPVSVNNFDDLRLYLHEWLRSQTAMTTRIILMAILMALIGIVAAILWFARREPTAPPPLASVGIRTQACDSMSRLGLKDPIRIDTLDETPRVLASVRASSHLPEHPPSHAFDGDITTAWCEQAAGSGQGQWIEATLNPGFSLVAIELGGGWSYYSPKAIEARALQGEVSDGDMWRMGNVAKRTKIEWSGGSDVISFQRTTDREVRKRVTIPAGIRKIRITFLDVDMTREGGNNACLDDIKIYADVQVKIPSACKGP